MATATVLSVNAAVQFVLSKTDAPFGKIKTGVSGIEYNTADLNAIFDRVYADNIDIAGSTNTTLDLTSLTDRLGDAINFSKILFVFILPTDSNVTIEPGASNGLELFGGTGRPVTVLDGGALLFGGKPSGTGITVDGTHKTVKLTNETATDMTVTIIIAGDG